MNHGREKMRSASEQKQSALGTERRGIYYSNLKIAIKEDDIYASASSCVTRMGIMSVAWIVKSIK